MNTSKYYGDHNSKIFQMRRPATARLKLLRIWQITPENDWLFIKSQLLSGTGSFASPKGRTLLESALNVVAIESMGIDSLAGGLLFLGMDCVAGLDACLPAFEREGLSATIRVNQQHSCLRKVPS